jgi:PAS domain S-box-containing protein
MSDTNFPPDDGSRNANESAASRLATLLASPGVLAKVVDLAEDAIVSVGSDQRILLFNAGAQRVFGYSSDEVLGQPLDILLPARMAGSHRSLVAGFDQSSQTARRKSERRPICGRRKDGTEFPAEASISRVDTGGQTMLTVILRDITERVAADEKLKESLREKEALLREIHHRVKNNLQVVSSLLGLQARAVPQDETRKAFRESQNRIHSMALLHEMLCGSNTLASIDLAEYTAQLAGHLLRSYGVDAERTQLRTDLDQVFLELDAAVPFGLITNELVTNALRHAFPGGRRGEIHIQLRRQPDQRIRLTVGDNGAGLAGQADLSTGNSLGFRLIRMLGEQLKATIEVRPRNPTEIHVTFPTH